MKKLIVLLLALAACGGSSATGPATPGTIVGTYTVSNINGYNVSPSAVGPFSDAQMRLISIFGGAKLAIAADQTYALTRDWDNGNVPQHDVLDSGTWKLTGNAIDLTPVPSSGVPAWHGTADASTIVMAGDANHYQMEFDR